MDGTDIFMIFHSVTLGMVILCCACRRTNTAAEGSPGSKNSQTTANPIDNELIVKETGTSPGVPTELSTDEIYKLKVYTHSQNEIGSGSFGKVYRGICKGKHVAIKKIEHGEDQYTKNSVEKEVKLLRGKKHRNLTRLLGWLMEDDTAYLIYEYATGCSLFDYLRTRRPSPSLTWGQLLGIAIDVAEALKYLHGEKIIHGDIKPANIMLDEGYGPAKLIDFGLSRHADWEGTHLSIATVAGTRGYWAPEYCWHHRLSFQHDTYGFGIVLLELITGLRHVDDNRGSTFFHIAKYVSYKIQAHSVEEIIDKRIKEDPDWMSDSDNMKNAVLAVAKLALHCADKERKNRPSMEDVVMVLEMVRDKSVQDGILPPMQSILNRKRSLPVASDSEFEINFSISSDTELQNSLSTIS